jgi:hypothetical protein
MTCDPWHLVLVPAAGGTTVPVRVWLPPLPGAPAVGAEPDQQETGGLAGAVSEAWPATLITSRASPGDAARASGTTR